MEKIDPDLIFNINTNHEFEALSFKIFDYQINNNEIYKKYASLILKDKMPNKITEIPFLPINFVKSEQIITNKLQAQITFKSSGTQGLRSNHHIADLDRHKPMLRGLFFPKGQLP